MTEEIKNGVENGVGEQVGGNGDKQADGVKDSVKDSNVEEIAKLKEENKKLHAKVSEIAEERKRQAEEAEKNRLASLSTEEQLKEMKAKLDAQDEERSFNEAFSSNGLNPAQHRKALEMFKNKDFNGLASFMAGIINETASSASQKSVDEFKSKLTTSKAPDVNNSNGTEDVLKSMGLL